MAAAHGADQPTGPGLLDPRRDHGRAHRAVAEADQRARRGRAGQAGYSLPSRPRPPWPGTGMAAPRIPRVQPARGLGTLRPRPVRLPKAAQFRPTAVTWPAPARATLRLGGGGPAPQTAAGRAASPFSSAAAAAYAPGTPVWAQPLPAAGGRAAAVGVRVLSHAAALAAGVRGVVFTAGSLTAGSAGRVRLGLSYAGFSQVYGGNYGLGLGLAELPACALTTPQQPRCRSQKRLGSVNDPAAQTVSAQVTVPGAAGTMVLAAAPLLTDGGGPAGTYSATSLRASGTWAEGGSSGAFTYSYPMPVPAAATSLVPPLSLNYDSGTVDGQTSATQAQAAWAGDGWSTPASFIEQSFLPCADDASNSAPSTQDECYNGPILTLSQDGTSTPLVCNTPFSYTANSTCTPADDNGDVITHHVNSGNGSGTKFTDYWTVTTRTAHVLLRPQPPARLDQRERPGHQLRRLRAGVQRRTRPTRATQRRSLDGVHDGLPVEPGLRHQTCTATRWPTTTTRTPTPTTQNGDLRRRHLRPRQLPGPHRLRVHRRQRLHRARPRPGELHHRRPVLRRGTCDPIGSNAGELAGRALRPGLLRRRGTTCQVTGPTFWSTVRLDVHHHPAVERTAYVQADSWALSQQFPAN